MIVTILDEFSETDSDQIHIVGERIKKLMEGRSEFAFASFSGEYRTLYDYAVHLGYIGNKPAVCRNNYDDVRQIGDLR